MKKKEEVDVIAQKDVWNKWVFDLGLRGYFQGQESNKTRSLNFSVTAKQVTDKINLFKGKF